MTLTDTEFETLTQYMEAIEPERKSLNNWERDFFDDQIQRYREHGQGMRLSTKQWNVLKKMYAKITGDQGEDPPPADERDYD